MSSSYRGAGRALLVLALLVLGCSSDRSKRVELESPDAATDMPPEPEVDAGEEDAGLLPIVPRPPRPDAGMEEVDAGPTLPVLDDAESPLELGAGEGEDEALFDDERTARALFAATPIAATGTLVDESGMPVAEAEVHVDTMTVRSDASGRFVLTGLARRNRFITITKAGYFDVVLPAHLLEPLTRTEVDFGLVHMAERAEDTVRFLFGGDVSFGRNFIGLDNEAERGYIPDDSPIAFIKTSDPAPGSIESMQWVRPLLRAADFPTFNLETPVTDDVSTPHPNKAYVFFTLPGSLKALLDVNVSFVNIGNNHLYDQLELGLTETMRHLTAEGIGFSGGGITPDLAFGAYRRELAGHPYSFIGGTSVRGEQSPPLYVATSDPLKGGAADLKDEDRLRGFISAERDAGRSPIVQLHQGAEYAFFVNSVAQRGIDVSVEAGAALVIAHHPHVAQGFGWQDGVLVAHSLGNFCFDQERLETMLGVLARVDMAGGRVKQTEVVPIYLEDYRPRVVTGALARYLMRRVAEESLDDAAEITERYGQGFLASEGATIQQKTRTVALPVTLDARGYTVLDLRPHLMEGESLVHVASTSALTGKPGEDLMMHGDFEDWDVDSDVMETARWDMSSSSRYPCVHEPHRGAVAVCSARQAGQTSYSVLNFDSRVRFRFDQQYAINKDVSFVGYLRGDNAGRVKGLVRYHASSGELVFGEEVLVDKEAGSYPWTFFAVDLHVPPEFGPITSGNNDENNPRAVRVQFTHDPPAAGKGVARYDDLAVVSWRAASDLTTGLALPAPNPIDFVHVAGAPGPHTLQVTFEQRVAE